MSDLVSAGRAPRALGALALGALAGCGGGGGGGGGGDAMPPDPSALELELRRDAHVANAGLIDAACVDLDGDALLDLAECDYADRTVAIGRGRADGSFAAQQFLVAPGRPWTIAAADFDGDGRVDLAAACHGDALPAGVVQLWLQASDGQFVAQPSLDLAESAFDLCAAPLSGNGRMQLVYTQLGAARTTVLDRATSGAWTEVAVLSSSALAAVGRPHAAEALDLDADGVLDIAVAEIEVNCVSGASADRVVWHRGLGGGSFAAPAVLLDGLQRPLLSKLADTDANGFAELGVVQMDAGTAYVLAPRADDSPSVSAIDFGYGYGATSLVLGDLDGDGRFEAAATLWREQALAVCRGASASTWDAPRYYNVGTAPRGVALFQAPADAHPGLLCVNSGDVSILRGDGAGLLLAARGYRLGASPSLLACADLDADGRTDALSVDASSGSLALLRGLEDGAFALQQNVPIALASGQVPGGLCARDFDADGDLDLLSTLPALDEVHLVKNPGGFSFGPAGPLERFQMDDACTGVAAADLDGDGDVDAVLGCAGAQSYQILRNGGAGAFAVELAQPLGAAPQALELADLDADGTLDLCVTTAQSPLAPARLQLLRGDGAAFGAGSGASAVIELPAESDEIHAGDLDGDATSELVLAQNGNVAHALVVVRAHAFASPSSALVPIGYAPGSVALVDADGDLDLDLVCPLGQGALRVARNDGNGAFPTLWPLEAVSDGAPVNAYASALGDGEWPVPFATGATCATDADQDGDLDLLLVSPHSSLLWVARNMSAAH